MNFPLGTIAVNVSACPLLGLPRGGSPHGVPWTPGGFKFILGTGLLGGYSTFSTASVEGFRLIEHGHHLRALAHAGGMLLVSVLAGILGVVIMTAIFR